MTVRMRTVYLEVCHIPGTCSSLVSSKIPSVILPRFKFRRGRYCVGVRLDRGLWNRRGHHLKSRHHFTFQRRQMFAYIQSCVVRLVCKGIILWGGRLR